MKILVIDDNPVNLKAAEQVFKNHNLTTFSTHEEAEKILSWTDEQKEDELTEQLEELGMDWKCAVTKAYEESTIKFDVVLIDLLMPAGPMRQGEKGRVFVLKKMMKTYVLP